ncbi:hypothetical protein AKO1_004739, partial [Acrasis kona]
MKKIPLNDKLYGRDEELKMMKNILNKTREQERLQIITITGFSGIGKSTLALELQKQIKNDDGHFIIGKYDQLNRSTPYSAISDALEDMVKQITSKGQEEFLTWKNKFLKSF